MKNFALVVMWAPNLTLLLCLINRLPQGQLSFDLLFSTLMVTITITAAAVYVGNGGDR